MASNTTSTVPQSSLFTALDKLEEQVTCGVCNEQFTDPRTLPCLHSFCLECVKETFVNLKEPRSCVGAEYLIRCPLCKKLAISSDPHGQTLPRAHHLTSLIGVKQDFFLPLTYHISSSLCFKHKEEIKLYCIQCSLGVCLECTVKDHAHHELRRLRLSELYLPEDGDEDGWIKVNHPLLTSLNSWPHPPEGSPLPNRGHYPRIDEGSLERHSSQDTLESRGEGVTVGGVKHGPCSRVMPSFRQYIHEGSVGSSPDVPSTTIAPFRQYTRQVGGGSNTTIHTTHNTGPYSAAYPTVTTATTSKPTVSSSHPHIASTNSDNSDRIFQVILDEYDLVRT